MSTDNKTAAKSSLGVKKVMVLTTAVLTFIPFWKAAAVVLCDFGSSAFYAGGIAMRAFGPAFPWYILFVMLFSGILLTVYIESCSLFVRGGIYKVVKEGLGNRAAKIAASAIVFDFILTGPISAVTAGHYLSGFINSTMSYFSVNIRVPDNTFSIIFALAVTVYFWRQNIRGISESTDKSAKIILFSLIVAFVLAVWAIITIFIKGASLPPLKPQFTEYALGWSTKFDWMKAVGLMGVMMAIGHSVLALSGLETLSQVYREIEFPKIENLKKAAITVFIFALLFTGGLTFLSSVIIPSDLIAAKYHENLLSGLAMELSGPKILRLFMQAALVISGTIMLSGAVNTALIGSNAVLNRIAEDGILTDWFRKIHKKHGTTYHMINLIVVIQMAVIIFSGGKVYLLGEAYAFGVLWSAVLETLSLIMLRFKQPQTRTFMVPLNFKFRNYTIPLGATLIFLFLFSLASINLLTKRTATISGLTFTAILYTVFYISERLNAKKANIMFEEGHREEINTSTVSTLNEALEDLEHQDRVVIGVKNPDNLYHLEEFLKTVEGDSTDIIVLYAKPSKDTIFGKGSLKAAPMDDKEIFSNVILIAEKYGHGIIPLMVESNDPYYAISQVAHTADADNIILGVSGSHGANDQMERMVMAWGAVHDKKLDHPVIVKILWEGREVTFKFNR
ncbi:Putative amino acid transporter [Elusimicrobium minutum Pei191]|uniref:Putative amino acid transporter n=1 Tax=Elusimicrobium minutum (strain Pei191) TaxID=445932 RepID=B2KDR0_ELUMP|nr:APC family permease [Elusimicrobium minutum]ACC98656.1 Putative amino acid transporter [Elusimicrobium minutum Pei191]